MTPKELQAAFRAVKQDFGPRVHVGIYVNDGVLDDQPLGAMAWSRDTDLTVRADGATWEEVFALLRKLWAKSNQKEVDAITRRMALKIIELTADNGECRHRDLVRHFPSSVIDRYGAKAAEEAERLSGKPFRIIPADDVRMSA